VELAAIDARLSLLEQTPVRFGLATGGQVRSASTLRYLVSAGAAAGDSLLFTLATRRSYAAWAETLALRVGEGGDQVPPAFTGQAQVWWGEEGFTVLYGRDDIVEGGRVEQVEVLLSPATGGPAIPLPLEASRGYWRGLLRGVPVGEYTYLLTAVDQAGNAGRSSALPLLLGESRQFGQTRVLLGGGTRTGPAIGTYRQVLGPIGLAVDQQGRLWVADAGLHQVIRWDRAGVAEVIAGAVPSRAGLAGDGGPAVDALLNQPTGLAIDIRGRVYVADSRNHRVRRLDLDGTISTVAGTDSGFSGDNGPASTARLASPQGLALDRAGNLYLADTGNRRVRRVDTQGIITTVAGSGASASSGDGGPATAAGLLEPLAVAVDTSGNLYIADGAGHRVRRIGVDGVITTAAGTGSQRSPAGDGAPAATVQLRQPCGLLLDGAGALYIADRYRVSRVDPRGIFTTVMTTAEDQVVLPAGLAADERGDLYVGDPGLQRVLVKVGAVAPLPPVSTATPEGALPTAFALWPNYPNPFNPATLIRFSLASRGAAELAIYDLLGQQVRLLLAGPLEAGPHQVRWDGRDQQGRSAASGVYLLDLQAAGQRQTRKMLLLR
ncbi:MAG: SMP-30/gluconolactonase/LRE family protein, partial [Candidatus Latescibacterota bacterium]